MGRIQVPVAAFFAVAICCGAAQAATLAVGHGGGYDFATITESLAAALSGDAILVAGGTYTEASGETFPLMMKQGVVLSRASVDLLPAIDASGSGGRVFQWMNLSGGTRIDGLLVTGGNAAGFLLEGHGGGLYLESSTITIANCTIVGNTASENGGGICRYDHSSPTISNCKISGNLAIDFPFQALVGARGGETTRLTNMLRLIVE